MDRTIKGRILSGTSPRAQLPSLATEARPWCLQVVLGPVLGVCHALADTALIGREGSVDIKLGEASVSRRHCHVYRKRGGYWVTDLGATNPTRVNGMQVTASPILDGDLLTIGDVVLKLLAPDNPANELPPLAADPAGRDSLTGLALRPQLRAMLETVFGGAARGSEIALYVLDIDHFKHVNDRFSHAAGDRVLSVVARVMRDQSRPRDLAARIGGQEFAMLLPQTTKVEALRMAERLRLSLAALQLLEDGEPLVITATFGVAAVRVPEGNADLLYSRADEALYQGKRAGRNRVSTLADEPPVMSTQTLPAVRD